MYQDTQIQEPWQRMHAFATGVSGGAGSMHPIGPVALGKLPIVSRFMKGVFRMNTPQPKLCTTRKVQVALDHLKRLRPVEELSLREISGNLVLLLALTSAARAHELAALDLDHLTEKEDSWEFTLAVHVKQSRPGHPARKIYLPAYPVNRKLCVVTTVRAYRARTIAIRQFLKLLLALIAPHAPISSQTVSRWLRNILKLAEINPTFTGHSTRSASTTAAAEAGIPLELILEAADWSSAGTFRAHYLRPTGIGKETFANSVISG
ncbi:Integrase recombinase xerD-like [Paramuricea clavata]|uniref:Integrase recombinase xerD-like n=1 Tax=Paramuricea clavata TaxID=317549 RepID=A0A6S7FQW5_PARCT|nr:Integrase recombinase xerD-like [Paramuricea clavata]